MSVREIPEDVWETARALRGGVNWQSNASVETIAKVIMAERKRGRLEGLESAAKAVEELTVPGFHRDDLYRFSEVTGLVAAAIRALGGEDG